MIHGFTNLIMDYLKQLDSESMFAINLTHYPGCIEKKYRALWRHICLGVTRPKKDSTQKCGNHLLPSSEVKTTFK